MNRAQPMAMRLINTITTVVGFSWDQFIQERDLMYSILPKVLTEVECGHAKLMQTTSTADCGVQTMQTMQINWALFSNTVFRIHPVAINFNSSFFQFWLQKIVQYIWMFVTYPKAA